MYDNSMEHNENWKDSNKPIGIWTEDEKIKLDYLIQFIDEFISSQEYEDYMEKKRNIIKKNAETQYSQDDFIDLPSEEVETCKKYFPLTSNSKKMYAFIKKFEIYLKNKEHENIMQKQIKGIAIIRAKIEDVKKLTALSVNDIKRAREKELDEETKDFCKLYNIDFNKVRQENKKNIKEKIASHSRMLRIRYITRRENIANIARTILEEMRRNKKILERLNKTYDYKVTKNEWIIEDMVVVGTAMSLHKQETESNIVEEPSPVVVVEDNEIASPKKEKRDKGKKKTKKEAKADKVEKKVDKKVDKKDKKNKKVKKKEKDEKKKKGLKEKKSKKSKKGQPDDAIPIELTLSQEQQIAELNEQFEKFDEMMENQHMAKQSPEENYPIDRNFSCHPQTLLYNNYDIGKVYKRYFKIRNNSFMPRKFRFLKMITANEYDALLFELKPLIGIQKLVGGASISMLLTFTPTYKYEEIDAELIFLSFDDRTQSYQKFCVCVQCILKRANLQISSDHIYFGKIPFWQTSRCMKRLTFSNIGGEPCDIYIKKIKDTFDVEDEAITNVSNNDSTLELNDDLENQDVIRNVTSEIIENVLGNFHFTCTYIKLDSFETKAISIFLKNMDYYGSYIEKHLVEAYDENNKNFANFEVVTEAYITGPFISVFPEVLDYEICSINSVYQLPMDIKNSSSTTQAVAIKVPFSIKDYVKPDVINIYLPPMATRTVIIRLVLGKNIMNTIYFDKELSLLKLNIQVCILTKNYNEIPPVIATVYAVITVSNILSINPVDNTFVNYMSNCLILDVGKCTIFESVYTDIEVKNNSLIPQIYGFMDVPHWITIEPNYGFTEITPGSKQTYRVFVHPDYQDLLKNFDKKKTKDRCLTSVIRIETVNNTRAPNTFFDTKKLRKSIQFVLKEMNNSIDDVLKEDISDCMRLIKQTYFNNEESIILNPEGMTEISMYNDNEEENDSYEEEDNCNITQLMIKVEVMKPLVEVSFQHIELPDTPCGSYSVISFDIRALRFEFNQECELFRKKDMKLQKYEAWFKITGDNKEIRVEPSCGILKNGETMKIFLIATPNIPEYIVQETARSIKYSEIYEMKMKEIESNKHKKMRKNDKKKTKKGGKTKPKKSGKDKKGKKVDKKKTKKAASSTVEEKKEEEVEPEIIISDSEINVTYEDYFPSEMCYWRSMKPYTISSELTCVVTYNSDFFVRPKELINMNVYCRVVRPDFISNLKLQRVDFGNVAVGMSDNKNVIIQNIKYDTIEIKTNLLNPVGPFSVSYIKNPKIPGECYMNLPLKFSPKSNEFFEEYIEITSGTTVLPLILQGVGVDTKVTFSPDFLVCRLNKATTRTIEEYLLKIQNLSEAPVTFVFEKVFEIEGIVKSVPVVKKEQKKKKNDTKGDGDKASRKSKGSKKSKESNGSKVKGAKKFSDDLSPSEINSIPTFEPTKNTTYFDILNVEKNSLTLQKNATGIVKFGFGTKAILDETKMQLKEKKKKEKTKKAKSPRVDKGSEKNIDVQDKKMTHITKYNILLGANIYKEIILIEMYNITKNVSSDFSQVDIGPMIGLIEKVVIMSARFKAFQKLKKLDETWKIIVNGQEDKPISLIIKGLVDVPSIEIGNKNEICLPTAQIDTVVTGNFNLKNTCHFNLSFTFYPNNHKFISMIPKTGDVLIGEEVSVTVVYHAEVCAPKVIEMYCKLHVKQKLDAIVGTDYDHYFTVNCEKAFSQLCATQISEEFNVVEYGSVIQTDFSLFNFGLSTVSFVLHIVRPMYNQDEIKLTPKSGNIDPGRQMQINLEIEFLSLGENEIKIEYSLRNSTKSSLNLIHLLEIVYTTIVGKIKIVEIAEHNFGALFAKTHFWDFFQIEKLNDAFMEIQPNQNEAFEIYLPECLLGSQHYVSLLIQNTSRFDTEISLKRKKMCSCVMKQSQVKINITKLVYDCPHRDLLLLENTNDTVKVNSTEMFTIKVTYNIPGETIMAYEIHLKHNRVFFLYFHIFGILPNTGRISAYNPHYTMLFKPVNLATRSPPTQVFWLYNNSELPMEIEVNEEKLNAFCKKENYKIFECITQNGEVKPFSIFGLNFKFCPIELKKYKMNLPILLNGIETVLILEGFGTSKWPLEKEHLHISMPQSSQSKNKFPVVFSADYIIFECLPIWNHTEKIIFIENITKNKVIYYEWSSVNIPKYVKITAGEETGYLLPSQSHAVTVKVESFYESLLADFILTCQLTDLQQLFTMKKIEQLQKRYDTENENVLEFSTKKQKEKVATIKKEKCAEENSIQTFNDPVMYIMALTVRVNIVHRKDVNFTEIIKYYPIDVSCCTRRNVNVFQETWINNELQINITEHVLNRIISDVVFSRAFKGVVKAMKEKTHMNYIQFEKNEKLATSNSEKKLETFFSRPPLTVLSETLKTFIEDSFFDTFNISTAHKEGENGEQNEGRDKESVINSIIEHLAEICRDECTCKVEK